MRREKNFLSVLSVFCFVGIVLTICASFSISEAQDRIPPSVINTGRKMMLPTDNNVSASYIPTQQEYFIIFNGMDDLGLYSDFATVKEDGSIVSLSAYTHSLWDFFTYTRAEVRLKSESEKSVLWNIYPQNGFYGAYSGKYDDAISDINKAIALTYATIGVNISIKDNYPVITNLWASGPADKAGVKLGDRIIDINGQSTEGWDEDKVNQSLRDEAETDVTITIERKGKKIKKTIKREKLTEVSTTNRASLLGLRSLIYAVKGDYEKASKDAETAYSINMNDGWAKSAISYSYIITGKPDEAVKILSTMKDSPFDRLIGSFSYLLEALAYSKKGDLKKSAEIYASIPDNYILSNSAFHQYFKNVLLESLSPFVESKKEGVKNLEAKGQYREALKEYAELLKIADQTKRKEILGHVAVLLKEKPYLMELPEEARKYAIRAEVMTKEGKFAEAVKEYKEAIKIAPFYPLLYKAIALNYAELKDYKKAIENMNTYIELYPDAPDVRAAKDEIYKWEFMMEKGGK